MNISVLLQSNAIIPNLRVASKKQVLQELSRRATDILSESGVKQTEQEIFDILQERERLGTTGVGQGIAIPHGKLAGLSQVFGLFARLEHAVAFESIDEQPVDLIFMLLAPTVSGAEHLKALALVSRLLRDQSICSKLRGTQTADGLYVLLTQSGSEKE